MNYTCLPYLVLNPSFPNIESNYNFTPDQEVFVPILCDEDFPKGLICNVAFKTEIAVRTHFWFKEKNIKVNKITVRDFLKTHDWTGMDPFETLNKMEFLTLYRKKYPEL